MEAVLVVVRCGYGTCFAVRTSTLALKPSVSPPYYPWVTATVLTPQKPPSASKSYAPWVIIMYYLNIVKATTASFVTVYLRPTVPEREHI